MHVIQRGNDRMVTFRAPRDYRHYLDLLEDAANASGVDIHAYALMSNHVHLVASPCAADSLPKTMQSVGRSYVSWFNRKYGRTGTLWEGRYRATVIDTDRYLLTCMVYVEQNPDRAGLVDLPGDYRWSSYRANALGAGDPLVTPHRTYLALAEGRLNRLEAYQALCNRSVPEDQLRAIRSSTNLAWVLGDDSFQRLVEDKTGRRSAPRYSKLFRAALCGSPAEPADGNSGYLAPRIESDPIQGRNDYRSYGIGGIESDPNRG
jgi:putative transposase